MNNCRVFGYLSELKRYCTELIKLALPVFGGQVGHLLTGFADVLVLGRYGTPELAAVSIANAIIFTIFTFGLGLQRAISICLSNKRGSGESIKCYYKPALALSALMSLLFVLICLSVIPLIGAAGFPLEIVHDIKIYIFITAFSLPGIFIFQGIKEFLQSYEIVAFPNKLLLYSVFVNFILNVLFVYGFGIIPEGGVTGAAIATFIVRTAVALIMLMFTVKYIRHGHSFDFDFAKYVIKVGMPIGFSNLIEFLAYNVVSILAGRISVVLAASHNLLVMITSTTFVVSYSLSIALSIKTAYFYGAKKFKEIMNYIYSAYILAGVLLAVIISLIVAFAGNITGFFTKDADILITIVSMLPVIALYQLFDFFQTITGGVLNGFKLTKEVTFCVACGYWLIGAPAAYIAVNNYHLSLNGYWIALAVSLFAIGIFEFVFAVRKLRKIYKTEF